MPTPSHLRREYLREYQRKWIKKRRDDYFKDKSCRKCGATDRLQLDHVDPTKKVSHNIWSWSAKRRDVELAKCQVLCDPCHKAKSKSQLLITHGFKAMRHGSPGMYRQGCRCGLCKLYRKNLHRKEKTQEEARRVA